MLQMRDVTCRIPAELTHPTRPRAGLEVPTLQDELCWEALPEEIRALAHRVLGGVPRATPWQ